MKEIITEALTIVKIVEEVLVIANKHTGEEAEVTTERGK